MASECSTNEASGDLARLVSPRREDDDAPPAKKSPMRLVPTEVVARVLDGLSASEFTRCAAACRAFRRALRCAGRVASKVRPSRRRRPRNIHVAPRGGAATRPPRRHRPRSNTIVVSPKSRVAQVQVAPGGDPRDENSGSGGRGSELPRPLPEFDRRLCRGRRRAVAALRHGAPPFAAGPAPRGNRRRGSRRRRGHRFSAGRGGAAAAGRPRVVAPDCPRVAASLRTRIVRWSRRRRGAALVRSNTAPPRPSAGASST